MKKEKGFTLIELMVTVAIVGILAAIAYPSYLEHVRKAKLSQIKEGLMTTASRLERELASNNAYPSEVSGLPYADQITYTYARVVGDTRNYYLSGYIGGNMKVWAGITSSNVRCECKKCNEPTFTAATTTCPTGTTSF